MKKILIIFTVFLLTGCAATQENSDGIEENEVNDVAEAENEENLPDVTENFKLVAAPGYVKPGNTTDPRTFVVDVDTKEVYVETSVEGFTEEELELIESMTAEEADEHFGFSEYEEPLYEIDHIEITDDSIVLEYNDETVVFEALSESYYETENGIRYIIEGNESIAAYKNSLMVDY